MQRTKLKGATMIRRFFYLLMVLAALHDNLLAEEIGFFTDGSKIPLKIDSSFMVIATTLQLNPEDEIALAISLPSVIRVDPALAVPAKCRFALFHCEASKLS